MMENKKKDTNEKWSEKYKKSIDCNNPKGFSQKAHCQGRKKKETKEAITVAPVSKKFVKSVIDKEEETNEMTGADAAGSFEPAMALTKKEMYEKYVKNINEALDASGFDYDAPIGGGRKNPLQTDTPQNVYGKLRSVKDKKFPKWGGPGGVFIKIKEKCKKFPYCNQGDINAIETLSESITKLAEELKIPRNEIEKLVLNEINKIFIGYENESSNRSN